MSNLTEALLKLNYELHELGVDVQQVFLEFTKEDYKKAFQHIIDDPSAIALTKPAPTDGINSIRYKIRD